jgi:hypothetical protein
MQYVLKPTINSNNASFAKSISMLQYLKVIDQMCPTIMVVPLLDDLFNRSKSNIAWIEGTMNGAVVVAPDNGSWDQPGIVKYESKEEFKSKTQDLINNPNQLKELWTESFNYIKQNLTLAKINRKRYNLINEVIKGE